MKKLFDRKVKATVRVEQLNRELQGRALRHCGVRVRCCG